MHYHKIARHVDRSFLATFPSFGAVELPKEGVRVKPRTPFACHQATIVRRVSRKRLPFKVSTNAKRKYLIAQGATKISKRLPGPFLKITAYFAIIYEENVKNSLRTIKLAEVLGGWESSFPFCAARHFRGKRSSGFRRDAVRCPSLRSKNRLHDLCDLATYLEFKFHVREARKPCNRHHRPLIICFHTTRGALHTTNTASVAILSGAHVSGNLAAREYLELEYYSTFQS
jgi:hypothetical protein